MIARNMAPDEELMADVDIPIDLMRKVGLLDNPEVAPYIQREVVNLTTNEMITLLAGAGLLTERQAAAYVHRRIEDHSRPESAETMDIAASTLDDYLRAAEDKVGMAQMTGRVVELLEDE